MICYMYLTLWLYE